ncbi:MAG: hypothetical protein ACRENX_01215 [Candidatus Dormibacteria bacterium]
MPPGYWHRLDEPCDCGGSHGGGAAAVAVRPSPAPRRTPAGPVVRWHIRGRDGAVVAVHCRRDYTDGSKQLWWEQPDGSRGLGGTPVRSLPLYGTEHLATLLAETTIVVSEGEKATDAVNAVALGVRAVGTVTGAPTVPDAESLKPLLKFATVWLWPDADDVGERQMAGVAALLAELGHRDVRRLSDPGAARGSHDDAADFVDRGGDGAGLRKLLHAAQPWAPPAAQPDKPLKAVGPSKADELLDLARTAGAEAFACDGRPYLSVPIGKHVETWPLSARAGAAPAARHFLRRLFRERSGRSPARETLTAAVEEFADQAQFSGLDRPVYLRAARLDDGRICIDLGDPDWTAAVVGPGGWSIEPHPVRFRRPPALRPLPVPVRGGSIDELWDHVNLRDPSDQRLYTVALTAVLFPGVPCPVFLFVGEHGTAKSAGAEVVRALTDPVVAPLRALPKDRQELAVAARSGWCLVFDNVSGLPAAMSDAICQLTTGGGSGARQLYSDDEEAVINAQRPVIVTSIEAVATRGDLGDRAVTIEFPPITEERRRTDREFRVGLQTASPRLFGAVLDLLSGALRELPNVAETSPIRMADFYELGVACERALDWPPGSFRRDCVESAGAATESALGASPLPPHLVRIANAEEGFITPEGGVRRGFEGTAAQLLRRLNEPGESTEDERRARSWPSDPTRLGGWLRRLAPGLRAQGIEIEQDRHGHGRRRLVRIYPSNLPETASAASAASAGAESTSKSAESADAAADAGADAGHGDGPRGADAADAGGRWAEPLASSPSPPISKSNGVETGAADAADAHFAPLGKEERKRDDGASSVAAPSDAATEEGLAIVLGSAESVGDLQVLAREFEPTIARLPAERQAQIRAAFAGRRARLRPTAADRPAAAEAP